MSLFHTTPINLKSYFLLIWSYFWIFVYQQWHLTWKISPHHDSPVAKNRLSPRRLPKRSPRRPWEPQEPPVENSCSTEQDQIPLVVFSTTTYKGGIWTTHGFFSSEKILYNKQDMRMIENVEKCVECGLLACNCFEHRFTISYYIHLYPMKKLIEHQTPNYKANVCIFLPSRLTTMQCITVRMEVHIELVWDTSPSWQAGHVIFDPSASILALYLGSPDQGHMRWCRKEQLGMEANT